MKSKSFKKRKIRRTRKTKRGGSKTEINDKKKCKFALYFLDKKNNTDNINLENDKVLLDNYNIMIDKDDIDNSKIILEYLNYCFENQKKNCWSKNTKNMHVLY